ncbi:MAG: OB-fold nucleic acid binding domain-containing protein, partial [Lachnospiraceae bacterium]|nr:OB-fold nucleic acid binding domain-containing protein [Lachnospiraceae bacterium]
MPAKNNSKDNNQLLQIRRDKLKELQAAGRDPFKITKYDQTHHSSDIKENFDALEFEPPVDADGNHEVVPLEDIPKDKVVSIAGRIMFKRVMGKASFANVRDLKGDIQIYVTRNDLGDDEYAYFKKYDVGDIIGVKGFVFKTKTGEISVHAKEVTLLSKSLQILPEKFHGLTDTDIRYRQRY